MKRIVSEINPSSPRTDRVFGLELCEHFGLDPSEIAKLVVWSVPEDPNTVAVRFYKFKRERGWWGFPGKFELDADGHPITESTETKYVRHG